MTTTKDASSREKLFHIVKRTDLPVWKSWLIRLAAIIGSLIICAIIIIAVTGDNPIQVYATMVKGAVGSTRRVWVLLQEIAMLLCVALAVTPAFKMRFWNIGAEGQVLIGGLGATAIMLKCGNLPAPVVLLLVIVTSIICGAIWGVIPAIFKAFWNTNETLFTLMMNYIAIQIVSYFTYIWSSNKGNNVINTINVDTRAGWFNLPQSVDKYGYLLNILLVAVLTVLMYFYLNRSKQGYEIAVVGESINTAKYAGINVRKVIIRTMLISGALCGVAGMLLVSGTDHTITPSTAGGRGFTAIMVSWLAKFNPLFMVLTSFLLIFMQRGAIEISTVFGLNTSFSDIITGIIIFFIIGSEFFINYSIKRNTRKGGSGEMIVSFIHRAVMQGIPLLYGATGEIITEKSGNLNLGIPGVMYVGGISGVIGAFLYENSLPDKSMANPFLAIMIPLLCSLIGSLIMGLIYSFLTTTLRANQNVTGLAITTFGVGLGNFFGGSLIKIIGADVPSISLSTTSKYFSATLPFAENLGWFGEIFLSYGFLAYLAVIIAIVSSIFLKRTRTGLNLRAVGENPATADAAGVNVTKYKYVSTCVGSMIAGLGGLYYVMDYVSGVWSNDGFGDRGWLAIALVIFTVWKPNFAIIGSILFGGLYIVHNYLNQFFPFIPVDMSTQELIKMAPYVVTVLVLIFNSMRNKRENQPPEALGLSYFREDR